MFISLFCLVEIEAQNIVSFPAGTTIDSGDPAVINNEQKYDLLMSGAKPTRVSQVLLHYQHTLWLAYHLTRLTM